MIPPERVGDELSPFPDHSDFVNCLLAVFSKKREGPWPTGHEVDPRTWYPDWQGLQEVVPKVPQEWGVKPNKKAARLGRKVKPGVRWRDPSNKGNHVRVDKGDPTSDLTTQQIDHVVINYRGAIRGPDGQAIQGRLEQNPDAHIPVADYVTWRTWCAP